jgi:hypothetical protein
MVCGIDTANASRHFHSDYITPNVLQTTSRRVVDLQNFQLDENRSNVLRNSHAHLL